MGLSDIRQDTMYIDYDIRQEIISRLKVVAFKVDPSDNIHEDGKRSLETHYVRC